MTTPREHVHGIDARAPAPPTSTFIPPEETARGREIEQPVGMLRATNEDEWKGALAFPAPRAYLDKVAGGRRQEKQRLAKQ